jgi:hypothetical protein
MAPNTLTHSGVRYSGCERESGLVSAMVVVFPAR